MGGYGSPDAQLRPMRIIDAPSNDNAAPSRRNSGLTPRDVGDVNPDPRMVVAHVLGGLEIGGTEQSVLDLACWQASHGHGVLVVSLGCPPRAPMARDFRSSGLPVHVVAKRPGLDATLPIRLSMLFARRRVDVVHTHGGLPLAYAAPAGRLARATVIHTRHDERCDEEDLGILQHGAGRLAHGFAVCSEREVHRTLLRGEVRADRIRCLRPGVDLDRFKPDATARHEIRRQLGLGSDAWVVGIVGRLTPDKSTDLVLRAVAPLLREADAVIMVGQGPGKGPLRTLAENLRIADKVRFAGARRDIPRWMAAFDVLCSASLSEDLPLVIPEAMATGLAVVAPSRGSIADVFAGEGGITVAPADTEAYRAALSALRDSPERRRQLGRHARQIARTRFSSERMAREYMRFYRELVERRAR